MANTTKLARKYQGTLIAILLAMDHPVNTRLQAQAVLEVDQKKWDRWKTGETTPTIAEMIDVANYALKNKLLVGLKVNNLAIDLLVATDPEIKNRIAKRLKMAQKMVKAIKYVEEHGQGFILPMPRVRGGEPFWKTLERIKARAEDFQETFSSQSADVWEEVAEEAVWEYWNQQFVIDEDIKKQAVKQEAIVFQNWKRRQPRKKAEVIPIENGKRRKKRES